MIIKEINPAGSFKNWSKIKLNILYNTSIDNTVGEILLFENEEIKVWSITLNPKERLPFHEHTMNYNWTCLTSGRSISYYKTGKIIETIYQKGDILFYDHSENGSFIHDIENNGTSILKFITVEYK